MESACELMDVQTVTGNLLIHDSDSVRVSSHYLEYNSVPAQQCYDITDLLTNGRVFLVQSEAGTSIELPLTFWEMEEVELSTALRQQFEQDLNW